MKLFSHLLMEQANLPPMPAPLLYVIAGNGVHLWAKRQGLEVLIPVTPCCIRDLYPVEPFVRLDGPPIPTRVVTEMLSLARAACCDHPREILFYLLLKQATAWHLVVPEQEQGMTRVTPGASVLATDLYQRTLTEIHSHHLLPAFFSQTDDADEQGFRLYGTLGRIFEERGPQIRMRVGVYGHFYEIPASWVMELPETIEDGVTQASIVREEREHDE